jgi:reactive intermediate/imine deaminase
MLSGSTAVALALSSFLVLQMPTKQVVSPGPAPVGPYSAAIKAGGFIYLSGTLAQDDAGAIVGQGDVATQTRRVIERMRQALASSGSSLEQVLTVTVYLRSAADFQAMNEAYRTFWPTDPPTRTTVITGLVLPDALVEMAMVAAPAGADRVVIHPASWITSPNPYSYAIRSGDTLFMSGIVSRNGRDNSVVGGDIVAQTKTVLDNAREILAAAGMTFANVVSARVYLPDGAGFQQMNETYRQYFPSAPPARATAIAGLAGPQYGVEITLVASSSPKEVINDGRTVSPNLSTAIRAGTRVYLSGMLGNNEGNTDDAGAQTRETLARMRSALAAAGLTPADIAESLVYLTDLKSFSAMNESYRPFFEKDFPARTTVGVGLLVPGGVVEIMAVAVAR